MISKYFKSESVFFNSITMGEIIMDFSFLIIISVFFRA